MAKVKDIDMGYAAAVTAIESLHGVSVEVRPDGDENIRKALLNEYGTATVPERSFIRSTIFEKESEYMDRKAELIGKVIDGKMNIAEALLSLGERMVEDIRHKAYALQSPPNAPKTIDKKGFDDPLIELEEMANSFIAEFTG